LGAGDFVPSRIFIHGLESGNQGTKSVFFREIYPGIIIPHFEGGLSERMRKLAEVLADVSEIRVVGSSFGGLMATLFAMGNSSRVSKLVLLAPALNLLAEVSHHRETIQIPTSIYHGLNDHLIQIKEIEMIAKDIFSSLSFHAVDDDHVARLGPALDLVETVLEGHWPDGAKAPFASGREDVSILADLEILEPVEMMVLDKQVHLDLFLSLAVIALDNHAGPGDHHLVNVALGSRADVVGIDVAGSPVEYFLLEFGGAPVDPGKPAAAAQKCKPNQDRGNKRQLLR